MNILEQNQKIDNEKPFFVHLTDHDGKPHYLPDTEGEDGAIGVMILGPHSKAAQVMSRKKAARGLLDAKKMQAKEPTAEQLEAKLLSIMAETAKELAEISVGWRNFQDGNGPREFDREELEKFYDNNPMYADQVAEAHKSEANFMKPA